MGPQVKKGSGDEKSSVQLWLKEVLGSSVLVSRSKTRVRVLSPVNELLGIVPAIETKAGLVKSWANVTEKNDRLMLLPLFVEPSDTGNLKVESGSESAETLGNP